MSHDMSTVNKWNQQDNITFLVAVYKLHSANVGEHISRNLQKFIPSQGSVWDLLFWGRSRVATSFLGGLGHVSPSPPLEIF